MKHVNIKRKRVRLFEYWRFCQYHIDMKIPWRLGNIFKKPLFLFGTWFELKPASSHPCKNSQVHKLRVINPARGRLNGLTHIACSLLTSTDTTHVHVRGPQEKNIHIPWIHVKRNSWKMSIWNRWKREREFGYILVVKRYMGGAELWIFW